jgi:hypothetical protein
MRIANETRYQAAQLRTIAQAVVAEERRRHGNPAAASGKWSWATLQVRFQTASVQSINWRLMGTVGTISVPPGGVSVRAVAAAVRQFTYWHRGVGTEDFPEDMRTGTASYLARFDAIVALVGERIPEREKVVVLPREAVPGIKPDRRMVALLHSRKLQAGWEARRAAAQRTVARARTAIAKLEREQRRLAKLIAADLEN